MTLREKFDKISCRDCDMPFCESPCTILSDGELNKLEQIADEFAIGFVDWLIKRETKYFESLKELLEIYKKEKGL